MITCDAKVIKKVKGYYYIIVFYSFFCHFTFFMYLCEQNLIIG